MLKKIFLFVLIALTIPAFSASAITYDAAFPSSDTVYYSKDIGFGNMGFGTSYYLWQAGEYVTETFTGTGLSYVNSLSYNFSYVNILYYGLTLDLLINGTQVDSFPLTRTSNNNVSGSVSFSPIFGGGEYTLKMLLTETEWGGSMQFQTGGNWTLGSDPVPEPGTLLLLGLGLIGLVGARRFKIN